MKCSASILLHNAHHSLAGTGHQSIAGYKFLFFPFRTIQSSEKACVTLSWVVVCVHGKAFIDTREYIFHFYVCDSIDLWNVNVAGWLLDVCVCGWQTFYAWLNLLREIRLCVSAQPLHTQWQPRINCFNFANASRFTELDWTSIAFECTTPSAIDRMLV